MLAIWNFAHVLTAAVYITWWGLKFRMEKFAKWWHQFSKKHFNFQELQIRWADLIYKNKIENTCLLYIFVLPKISKHVSIETKHISSHELDRVGVTNFIYVNLMMEERDTKKGDFTTIKLFGNLSISPLSHLTVTICSSFVYIILLCPSLPSYPSFC